MAIEKYTTEAFILKVYEAGEDDLMYKIWTREFGVILALAKSVRKINAKLRVRLQKNIFLSLTLVQGKNVWKLVGVEENNHHLEKKADKFIAEVNSVIAEVASRFLGENIIYKKLFDKLKSLVERCQDKNLRLDLKSLKTLIYYLVLVDTGYADARLIGVKDIEEYKRLQIEDFFTFFVLNQHDIRQHIIVLLKDSMV